MMMGNIVHRCILSGYVSNMILASESEKNTRKMSTRNIFMRFVLFFRCLVWDRTRGAATQKMADLCLENPIVINPFSSGLKWVHKSLAPSTSLAPVRATLGREMRKIEIMNELRIAQSDHVTVPCTGNQTTIFEKERKNYQWKWNFNAQIET